MSIGYKFSREREGLFSCFHIVILPGCKAWKWSRTVYSSHLIKLVWKVNYENKKYTGCQRDWLNTGTLIILLRIEKNNNIKYSRIARAMSDYPDSGIYHFFLVQGQRSQRKSVAHQDEHSFSVRSTVSISITDFGKVDPKFSEQWYFLGLRLPCFPLPFPYLGPELQHSRTEARKLSIHCSVSFLQQKFVGPSIFPKDNYSKPRLSQDRKTAPGVRKYGTFTCFPKQELFSSLPNQPEMCWLTYLLCLIVIHVHAMCKFSFPGRHRDNKHS